MISVDMLDSVPVARLSGDIDMSNIVTIEGAISGHVNSEAIGFALDLSDVTYLDSSGIRLIYQLDERARGRQQSFVLILPEASPINRTLEAAGMIGSVRIALTPDQALMVLRSA